MSNTMNTRPMTEGALLTALTVVFCLIGIYIPVLGGLAKIFWPVPIAILVLRHGLRTGIVATVVSGLILFMLTGPINFVVVILGFGLTGLVLGYTLKREVSPAQVVLWGAVASALSILAIFGLAVLTTGINPLDLAIKQSGIEKILPMWLETYRNAGMSEEQLKALESYVKNLPDLFRMIFPASLVMAAVTSSFMNFLVTRWVLKKMGQPVPGLPQFSQWRFPVWAAYAYLIGLGLMLFGDKLGFSSLHPIGVNLVAALSYLFVLEGIALLVFIFKDSSISRNVKFVIGLVAFIFLGQVFQLLVYVGIFDSIFDYRRILERRRNGV